MPDFSFSDDAVVQRLERMYQAPDMSALRAFILERLAARPGERVLDIGCGPGVTLAEIAGRGAAAAGVDVSEPMLEAARRRKLDVRRGDAQELPYPDASFNAVLCVQVLEYCTDPSRVVAESLRVLKPGGRIVFADTDWDTMVYSARDKGLTRRVVLAWSDHDSDGWLGRRLVPMFRAAKVRDVEPDVYVVTNHEYREPLMGWSLSRLAGEYVAKSGKLARAEVDRWYADLEEQDRTGQYYFSLNRYIVTGRRPA